MLAIAALESFEDRLSGLDEDGATVFLFHPEALELDPSEPAPDTENQTTIRQVIEGCRKVLDCCGREDIPIVVVNDGSTDSTAKYAEETRVHIIHHPQNLGKGMAIKTAISYAIEQHWDARLTIDADYQHDPNDIPSFLEAHQAQPDAIILGKRAFKEMPFLSKFSRTMAAFWFFAATSVLIKDTQTGFRLYPLNALKRMELTCGRFTTEWEILFKAVWLKIPVKDVAIKTIYYSGEKNQRRYRVFLDTARFFPVYFKLLLRRPWTKSQ